jgi:tetratricopeptide (TPR) repeat protein
MKKRIFIISIVIGCIFAGILFAQEGRGKGRLTGKLVDKDKKPVAGAKLTLEYVGKSNRLTAVTDKKGKWVFNGLGLGDARIVVEKEDFVTGLILVSVSGISNEPMTLTMHRIDRQQNPDQSSSQPVDSINADFSKAGVLYAEGRYQAALAIYLDIQSQRPGLSAAGFNIAACYMELRCYDDAINELNEVIRKILAGGEEAQGNENGNKELARAYALVGEAYMRQNKFADAEDYLKKSVEIDPSDFTVACNVGDILFAAGRAGESIPFYRLAVTLKPDQPKSYMRLGYAYLDKGDKLAAEENFKKFLELAPGSPEAGSVKQALETIEN